MKQISAVASVTALFLSGLAIGALGMFLYLAQRPLAPPPGLDGPPRRGWMLEEHLDLTPDQRRRIDEIHQQSRLRSEEIRRELRPRLQAQMEETRRLIREVLTPEQREVLERLEAEQGHRMERFLLGDGPPGRRGPRRGPPPDTP